MLAFPVRRTAAVVSRRCAPIYVLEALEPRRCFSVALDSATGLLSITGTSHADRIDVRFLESHADGQDFTSAKVTIDGHYRTFDHVSSLWVDARGGDDVVVLWVDNDVLDPASIHTTVLGGDGSDTLVGSSTTDYLMGQGGRD